MHLYRTSNVDTNPTTVLQFDGTLKDAHDSVKVIDKHRWPDIRVELVDVPADKERLLRLLNGDAVFDVLRTWKLTPRGGLTEIANGE